VNSTAGTLLRTRWPIREAGSGHGQYGCASVEIPRPGGIPGAWQYKFYTGVTPWPHDVLDHHVNSGTNDNSFIYTKDPTFYQVLPNQDQPVVTTATPTITAYIFPKVGAAVDPAAIQVTIDGSVFTGIGAPMTGPARNCVGLFPIRFPMEVTR